MRPYIVFLRKKFNIISSPFTHKVSQCRLLDGNNALSCVFLDQKKNPSDVHFLGDGKQLLVSPTTMIAAEN